MASETAHGGRAVTGQWFSGRDGQPWWFDSGSIPLDFAYTGGFDARWESLTAPERLASWLSARFPLSDGVVSDRDLLDAKALRASLASMALARSAGENLSATDVDVVNLFAATPDIPPTLPGGSLRAGSSTVRVSQALSAIAREAVRLFDAAGAARVRECAAPDCGLVFYDDSRSNNRRWCSMRRCGNRAKVRGYRERARSD